MRKGLILVCLIFVISSGMVFAQKNMEIPFVDITEANQQIADLEADTETRTATIAELQTSNTELEQNVISYQQELNNIVPLITQVERQSTELFAVNSTIIDAELKAQSREAIKRTRELLSGLSAQKKQLEKDIDDAEDTMKENNTQIRINEAVIAKNEDTIVVLQAAIEKTTNQKTQLESYLSNVDSLLSEAESYVSGNTTD